VSGAIDAHAHVIVREILRNGHRGEDWRPRVRREGGRPVVELGGREIRSMVAEVVDVETILAERSRHGIDAVVLCPFVPLLYPAAEPAACLERCRIQNRALAELASADPTRISALGAVPLQEPELAAAELRAIAADGALAGVEITASVGGAYVGDRRFEPFWLAAAETGALIFIHPTTRAFEQPVFAEHYLWNTVGNPFETTIAAAQMTMAGVMERHPRLNVLLAHGGGALPALRGRLTHSHTFQPEARSRLSESPLDSIRRFHFDTVTHDAEQLRALIEWAGPERALLGSDYPFDMADPDPVATVRSLGLDAEAERAVLGGNAARLVRPATGDPAAASEGAVR
jgi:aminocarboxymuconate-semialdehyde decarboxylase